MLLVHGRSEIERVENVRTRVGAVKRRGHGGDKSLALGRQMKRNAINVHLAREHTHTQQTL